MRGKRVFAVILVLAMVLVLDLIVIPPVQSNAATLNHVKATSSDVRNASNSNGALKGVQGTDFASMGDSVSNLNMNAMFLNVDLAWFVNTSGKGTYVGKIGSTKYYIDDVTEGGMYKVIEKEVTDYRKQGVTWNFCLLLGWNDINGKHDKGLEKLMYKPQAGHYYYAWNTTNAQSKAILQAVVDHLAEKYSYQDTFVQNWWINNEVNVLNDKIYSMDALDENALVTLAAQSYDMLYASLKKNNPAALAYVSVTHDWNNTNEGKGMSTKRFLDAFAKKVSYKNWNVDLHAYPPQMHEQVWTKASSAYLRNDLDTVCICAPNLDLFTDYIKANFGNNHRMIMSEQGFDSTYGENEQAVMMAYTYFKAQANPMIDEVIFTAYYDTDSAGHDFYKMGIRGNKASGYAKKASYNAFKYMNTSDAGTKLYPYFQKLVGFVGRDLKSWTDDILYRIPKTDARLQSGNLYCPGANQTVGSIFIGMNTTPANNQLDIEYRWEVFNYQTGVKTEVQGWKTNAEWLRWYPPSNGNYEIYCTARVAGNPSSTVTAQCTVGFNNIVTADVSSPVYFEEYDEGGIDDRTWPVSYQGYKFVKDGSNVVRCYDGKGKAVINQFKCDGKYTYYFQLDGTCMMDRLTYHPDGEHVIYFDRYGHEVFSNFAHVLKSISGDAVNDYCFFNVYGYMYVNVLTWNKAGDQIYYANPYGVLEVNKWFQFSDTVVWADGTPADGIRGQFGCANTNGTLKRNMYEWDWLGRFCYLQGNGVEIAYQ